MTVCKRCGLCKVMIAEKDIKRAAGQKTGTKEDCRTVKQKKGDWGEDRACAFLRKNGYEIVNRKYRSKLGEVDIIAKKGHILAFIEVKTRKRTDYGMPCEAVDGKKQHRLRRTAEYYILTNPWCRCMQPRMDIIEILCLQDGNYIRHLEDAF